MTDENESRRRTAPDANDPADPSIDEPEDALHGVMGVEAAAIGGMASGFPAAAIANVDLLGNDQKADGPRDDTGDAGDAGDAAVPGEGTTQRR